MPVEAKPLFRPDVLRPLLASFRPSKPLSELAQPLQQWAATLASPAAEKLNEKEILPDFLSGVFCGVLGYVRVVDNPCRFTFSREKHVQVDGKFADGVLGEFQDGKERFVVAIEGKGPKDPLDRPYAGRKMSAVDQGYRYAINLPCDWVAVTSMRQTRLYFKGADQHTYERFDTAALATDEGVLKKFVYLLSAERVVPEQGSCHLYELLAASERVGRELTKEFYLRYAEMRESVFDQFRTENPTVPPKELLQSTQKILDRVLFCSFAEDRGLLPAETVAKAYQHSDPYNPRPIWDNFRGLFRSINQGSQALKIHAYNGGLFADDPLVDRLSVPDGVCNFFRDLAAYDYRSGHTADVKPDDTYGKQLVDVDILGHIFEQSISDLERLRDELDGRAAPTTREQRVTRRKKEGAFYTPAFVTRYIVGQALGKVLDERFEEVRLRHVAAAEGTARRVVETPAEYDPAALNKPQKAALISFWQDWEDVLGHIRVLDPACGSGAFLLEAFDQLHAAYERANTHLEVLRGQRGLFDLDRQILQQNLFGVDLNEEAVQICRLSLWIKTAEQGKTLASLDANIRAGNRIVSEPTVDSRALNWASVFPEVFADGGFDVVVGNPPYVRQEWITPIKPYLEREFRAYHGMADLYVYFYELGLRVLRPGGRLGYIVTNKWLKAGYGEPLRKLYAEESWIESVVDFGHAKQIFPDADVFPCILVVQKPDSRAVPTTTRVCVVPREQLVIEDLSRQIDRMGSSVGRAKLDTAPWSLEPTEVDALLDKLKAAGQPLREYAKVRPLFGIKTGFNEAFLIDSSTKNAIVGEHRESSKLLRPYLRGQDVGRWHADWEGLWMIAIASSGDHPWAWADAGDRAEEIFRQEYPTVYEHLLKFKDQLLRRQDQGRYWWELRACAYWDKFDQPKLLYQDITWSPQVCIDTDKTLINNTIYLLPTNDTWLMAVLNSPLGWWYAWRKAQHGKDEALRFYGDFVENFPIAPPQPGDVDSTAQAVTQLVSLAKLRRDKTREFLDWLRSEMRVPKLSQKLQAFWSLSEEELVAEVRKLRGRTNSLSPSSLKALREAYAQYAPAVQQNIEESRAHEQTVSDAVFRAFTLTPDEVALMWKTAPPRTPGLPSFSGAS